MTYGINVWDIHQIKYWLNLSPRLRIFHPIFKFQKNCRFAKVAQGKMHNRTFLENPLHAAKPFECIHSDLREYPILSYSKYKYFISFLDDCTSAAWVILLWKKSDAYQATNEFLVSVDVKG
jgi:hypothetical protein